MTKDFGNEKSFFKKILQVMYDYLLDGIILAGFVLVFFGAVGVYLYNVFHGQTPPAGGELLTLLGVLLAILGLGGAGIYLWIYRAHESRLSKISSDIEKLVHDERIVSRADSEIAISLSMLYTHQFICQSPEYEKTIRNNSNNEEDDFVKQSVIFARIALSRLQSDINDGGKYLDFILKCKNNLVVALTFLFKPSEEDIKQAQKVSRELHQFVLDKKKSNVLPNYGFEATRALVLLRYPENANDRERSKAIYEKLLGPDSDIPEEDRSEIRKNKNLVEKILGETK